MAVGISSGEYCGTAFPTFRATLGPPEAMPGPWPTPPSLLPSSDPAASEATRSHFHFAMERRVNHPCPPPQEKLPCRAMVRGAGSGPAGKGGVESSARTWLGVLRPVFSWFCCCSNGAGGNAYWITRADCCIWGGKEGGAPSEQSPAQAHSPISCDRWLDEGSQGPQGEGAAPSVPLRGQTPGAQLQLHLHLLCA